MKALVEEKYCRYEYFCGNKRISADEYIKALQTENTKLKHQLQSYKDKEDKIMYFNILPPRSGKTYILNLEQQLQAYKSKEDKIREKVKAEYELSEDAFITHNDGCSIRHKAEYINGYKDMCEYILQILNDKVAE